MLFHALCVCVCVFVCMCVCVCMYACVRVRALRLCAACCVPETSAAVRMWPGTGALPSGSCRGQKLDSQQKGAKQCMRCMRWLKSAGGLAVHRCSVSTDSLAPAESISDESGYF